MEKVKHRLPRFVAISERDIHFSELFEDYSWVSTWKECDDIIRSIDRSRYALETLEKKSSRAKFLASLKKEMDYTRHYRVSALARAMEKMLKDNEQSSLGLHENWKPEIPWDEIQEAAEKLQFDLSDTEYIEEKARLEAEIAAGVDALEAMLPDERYTEHGEDKWEFAREHWLQVQGKILEACDPFGRELEKCTDEVMQAWLDLGIVRAMPTPPDSRSVPGWMGQHKTRRSMFGKAKFHAA